MATESVKEYYDRQYRSHDERKIACPNSLHDLTKAKRRVDSVLKHYGIGPFQAGAQILDVGSGLGYYTKALSETGAHVTGLDFSKAAIELGQNTFPECTFKHGAWHEDIPAEAQFDLIWTVNFSLVNTFDVEFIHQRLVTEALRRLKPNGSLVMGWNSDFSGRTIEGYSHWPLSMFDEMKRVCGFSSPFLCEAKTSVLSWFAVRLARAMGRSVPVFMVRKNT